MRGLNRRGAPLLLALGFALFPQSATAGSYFLTHCSDTVNCEMLGLVSDPGTTANPFGILHPPGYTGAGGVLELRICTDDPRLVRPTQRAIATWNSLTATVGNCENCKVWEDAQPPSGDFDAESVILHELGHCAFGLGHIDRPWNFATGDPPYSDTSLAMSAGVATVTGAILIGSDGIRGSHDDFHHSGLGPVADSLTYHRKADNNPVIVDSTVIDLDTYSRSVVAPGSLPPGDTWGATANYIVADALGEPMTQAVMYSLTAREMRTPTLSADDVSMVQLGMTGADSEAGTSDDYTLALLFVGDCVEPHDIPVSLGTTAEFTIVGQCGPIGVDLSFPQNPFLARHYTVTPGPSGLPLVLNDMLPWSFGAPDLLITKSDGGRTVGPGDDLLYALVVENLSGSDAENTIITETVPDGTSFNAGLSDPAWVCSDTTPGSVCTAAIGTVALGNLPIALVFAVTIASPTPVATVVNTTTVADDGANGPDEDPANNSATTMTALDVPCNGSMNVVLTAPQTEPTVVYEACDSVSAGTNFAIAAGRNVEFRARNLIALGNGFSVDEGAVFGAVIDPLAGQTAATATAARQE